MGHEFSLALFDFVFPLPQSKEIFIELSYQKRNLHLLDALAGVVSMQNCSPFIPKQAPERERRLVMHLQALFWYTALSDFNVALTEFLTTPV